MTALRLVTLNLWGATEPVAARMRLAREQLAALAVDVVCLQEVAPTGDGARTTADELAGALGMNLVQAGELAVLSRRPIRGHEIAPLPEDAALLSAVIDGPPEAWVHTTHLYHPLAGGVVRERQVVAAVDAIGRQDPERVHVLCGDFNADPESAEVRFLRGLGSLDGRSVHFQDAYARIHPGESGVTWCTARGPARALRSIDVDRRIDYVLVSTRRKDGRGTVIAADVAIARRDERGECASDHYGVFADIDLGPR